MIIMKSLKKFCTGPVVHLRKTYQRCLPEQLLDTRCQTMQCCMLQNKDLTYSKERPHSINPYLPADPMHSVNTSYIVPANCRSISVRRQTVDVIRGREELTGHSKIVFRKVSFVWSIDCSWWAFLTSPLIWSVYYRYANAAISVMISTCTYFC